MAATDVLVRYERYHRGEIEDAPPITQDELREFLSDSKAVAELNARAFAYDPPAMIAYFDILDAIDERERMRPEPRLRGIKYRQAPKRRRR
jgi:hypothetical protein